jgi:hypothetical protein
MIFVTQPNDAPTRSQPDSTKRLIMSAIKITVLLGVLSQVLGMGTQANLKTSVIESIQSHVSSYAPTKEQCGPGTNCCTVSSTESCGLTSMPKDQTTLVLPGGETRCIYSYSTPFAFQVNIPISHALLFIVDNNHHAILYRIFRLFPVLATS